MLSLKEKKYIIKMGSLAPSGGNMQPWKAKFEGDRLYLTIEPNRGSGALDYNNYASIFALGAFYENVYQVALNMGYCINLKKDFSKISAPLLSLDFIKSNKKSFKNLSAYIQKRATNRDMHRGKSISEKKVTKLNTIFNDFENIKISQIADSFSKAQVAKILGEGDRIRFLNKKLFEQMMSELRFSKNKSENFETGIDADTLEMPGKMSRLMSFLKENPKVLSKLNAEFFDNNALFLVKSSSNIGCITYSGEPDADSFFKSGQALERMWLTAEKLRIKIHPWSVLSFFFIRNRLSKDALFSSAEQKKLKDLEKKFRKLFKLPSIETPIFIFRMLSTQKDVKKSARLSIDKVATF